MKEFECTRTDAIICPYCGYEDKESSEYSEYDNSAFCGSCDKEFHLTVNVSVNYSTRKKEEVKKCQE